MRNPIIKAEHLVKVYHMGDVEVHALRGIDLEINAGDFIAIMGKSGSGKSTFMNIIGCLDVPTKGRCYLDKEDIQELSRDELARLRNKKIGFVFQSFNLLPRTSALENVELPLMYNRHMTSRQMKEHAFHALESVGLVERAYHMPNQLSGGEQQRVAIARALVNDPLVILADEPTGNLDTRTSLEIMGIFQQLNQKGITLVIVTHEQDIAAFTKRNVTFRDGRVVRDVKTQLVRNAAEEMAKLPVATEEEI
jgi:putative ABC transport system ATP-binding protein